jgi:adenylosuccinate lyase
MATERDYPDVMLTPLDGRYRGKVNGSRQSLSEDALILARCRVELHWLHFLLERDVVTGIRRPDAAQMDALRHFVAVLPADTVQRVRAIERTTNHDVKAVEYYLREILVKKGFTSDQLALLHFACTSEDINNTSYALMLNDVREKTILPQMDQILESIAGLVKVSAAMPMMSRTHGQPASPTTLGKELAVFGHRLLRQRLQFAEIRMEGKFNGAVGNYNAHNIALPQINWRELTAKFLQDHLRLQQNPLTTQIENHDSLVEYLDVVRRFCVISVGLCRDVWTYISYGYFRLKKVEGEVGSSTMPHKVNPIDFENAEGNLGIAVSLLQHLTEKLPISRMQRDLSDSTVLRSLGTALGHVELAMQSLLRGMSKLQCDSDALQKDLSQSYELLTEAVQSVMRRHGIMDAYEQLKEVSRGANISQSALHTFIRDVKGISEDDRKRLLSLTPATYLGDAEILAHEFLLHMHHKKPARMHV